MKVLQVLPELNSGGVERGTLEVADYLDLSLLHNEAYAATHGINCNPQSGRAFP